MPEPAVAVTTPGHVFTIFGTGATTTGPGAVGKVSVKMELNVIALLLSFSRYIFIVEVPPDGIAAGENSLLIAGGDEISICALVGSSLVTPSNVETALAEIVLVYVPEMLLRTSTLTVHDPDAGIVAPVRVRVAVDAVALTLPPAQVVDAEVPLAEMFGYATQLRSATQGRGVFSMEFDHYAPVAQSVAEEILKA